MNECVLAVDLGGTKVAAALVAGDGRILARAEEPVGRGTPASVIEQIGRMAEEMNRPALAKAGWSRRTARELRGGRIVAAGVAVPGLVRRDGTVWAPNLPGWTRVKLAERLSRRLRAPVSVESDRNATVLGEAWKGAARGKSDVVVLVVGTGIGAGILSGGRLVRGAHELSGCAGWMVVGDPKASHEGHEVHTKDTEEATRRCGLLEAFTAGPGIARAAGAGTAVEAAAAARRGDANAREVFGRAGRLLGAAVANLVSLFDPDVIVLGGGMAGAADLYLEELKRVVAERAQPLAAKQVKIRVSRLGAEANLLGAARGAMERAEGRGQRAKGKRQKAKRDA